MSDVSSIADSALTAGSVLFVPQEQAAELAVVARVDNSDNALRHVAFTLDAATLDALGGTAVAIDTAGRFAINVASGSYVVCLADTFADHTQGPPYAVVGCSRTTLPDGARLAVSFGEGGVEANLD